MFFLPTLDDIPFASSNLVGASLVSVGHRLMPAPSLYDDCSTLTNWTTSVGTTPTIVHGKVVLSSTTATTQTFATTIPSGDFDIAVDVDVVTSNWDTATPSGVSPARFQVSFGSSYIAVMKDQTAAGQWYMAYTGGTNAGTLTYTTLGLTASLAARFGTLRINRIGNVFTAYVWDFASNGWLQIGTTTQTYTGAATITLQQSGTTPAQKAIFSNLRSLRPVSTTSSATLGPFNTVNGASELAILLRGGTGTATVTLYKGATQAVTTGTGTLIATITASATGKYRQKVTADAANPWIIVSIAYSGLSTTATVPEIEFIGVKNQAIGQANVQRLFTKMAAMVNLHTDANNRLAIGEAAFSNTNGTTALISSCFGYIGKYINDGGGTSITSRGTTYSLTSAIFAGLDQAVADWNANSSAGGMVECNIILPSFWEARSTLVPLMTGTEKTNYTTYLTAQSFSNQGNNWHTFFATRDAVLTLLNAYDAGNWHTYADTALDSEINALALAGNGIINDSGTTGGHYDQYSLVVSNNFAALSRLRPDYAQTRNGNLDAYVRANTRNFLQIADDDGNTSFFGRSVYAMPTFVADSRMYISPVNQGKHLLLLTNNLWRYLLDAHYHGHDFGPRGCTRTANPNNLSNYSSFATENSRQIAPLMQTAFDAGFFNWTPANYPGMAQSLFVWNEAGKVLVRGSGAADPLIMLSARDWDTGTDMSFYSPRIAIPEFGSNILEGQTNGPNQQGSFFLWKSATDSDTSNYNFLCKPTSVSVAYLGSGGGMWRTGNATAFGTTEGVVTTSTPQTDVYLAFGHHVLCFTKLALGSVNASSMRFAGAPQPMPLSATAVNAVTNTTGTVYGYQENAAGLAECLTQILGSLALTPTTGYLNGTNATNGNRLDQKGLSVVMNYNTANFTGTQYFGVDHSTSRAPMTAATEAGFVSSVAQTGDLVTGLAGGTEDFLVHFAGTSSATIGNWTLTGTGCHMFSGSHTGATWFGGDNLTSVTNSGTLLASQTGPGWLHVSQTSSSVTRINASGGDLFVASAMLPAGFSQVLAFDADGGYLDITQYCTLSGAGLTVPGSVMALFNNGDWQLDVTNNTLLYPQGNKYVVQTANGPRPADFILHGSNAATN